MGVVCIDMEFALAHMVCHFLGVVHHDRSLAAENVRLDETEIIYIVRYNTMDHSDS